MKECFGNFMGYPVCQGHHTCKERNCFSKTSIDKGSCACEFKLYCHIPRQELQEEFRQENKNYKKEDCEFHKIFKEKIR